MPSPRRRLAAALAFLALLVAALPGVAIDQVRAHAGLVASSPGAGEVVAEPPDELRLVFSEPLESQVTSLDVTAEGGETVLSRAGDVDPDDPYALVVRDPGLTDGIYTVSWRTLSAADGHTAEGFFSFGVGDVDAEALDGTPGGTSHEDPPTVAVVGRWLTYLGLLLALGVPLVHRVVLRRGPMPRQLIRLLATGLGVAGLATAAQAVANAVDAGSVLDYLLGTRNGVVQASRALLAMAAASLLVALPSRVAGGVAVAAGLAGIALVVAAGHASALPGLAPMLGQVVHVAAVGVWLGGIGLLLLVLVRPAAATVDASRPPMSELLPRFSALALASIGLVALTGAYAAWAQTGTLLPLESEYGRLLALKTVLAAGAFALGGLNYVDGGRSLSWLGGLHRRLAIEVGAAAAVLFVTGTLATTPPLDQDPGVAIEPVPDAFGVVAPDMAMDVVPGRPGVNRVVVTTTDAMAAFPQLDLVLERVDAGTTTQVALTPGGEGGGGHAAHGGEGGGASDDGTVDWSADALVLPAGSRWDTSVRVVSADGVELARQRFAFALDDEGIEEGRVSSLLDPGTGVAIVLVLGGAIGVGLGAGGARLPRCETTASRIALGIGGATALALGGGIGLERLVGG